MKTEIMLLQTDRQKRENINNNLEGHVLQQPVSHKHLGVLIQQNLRWKEYVDDICSKANQRLGLLRLLQHNGMPEHCLQRVYNSLVRSTLEHASIVWTPSPGDSASLEVIQEKAKK